MNRFDIKQYLSSETEKGALAEVKHNLSMLSLTFKLL